MKHLIKTLAFSGALAALAPLAHATPISGSIGFNGNGTYNVALGQFTAGTPLYTGATGNAQVNTTNNGGTLSMFTFDNIANFFSFSTKPVPAGGATVFTTTEAGQTLTFKLTSFTADGTDPAGPGFTGAGILSETGTVNYTDTAANFQLNTTPGAGTFITFNTVAVAATPEPSSLILLGTGVLGAAGMLRRRFTGKSNA